MSQLAPERIDRIAQTASRRIDKLLRKELSQLDVSATAARTPAALARAARSLRVATGQVDSLRGLLAAAAELGARAAMFVVRPDGLEGWEGVGFEEDPGLEARLRGRRIAGTDKAVRQALETRRGVGTATGSDIPVPDFGQAIRGEALLLPLVVQDRTAGVLYVDPVSAETPLDRAGLETLVEMTGMAIERNVMARARVQAAASVAEAPPAPAAASPAPEPAKPAAAAAPETPATPAPAPAPAAPPRAAALPQPADPECADALRFARLLMDEICLYNGEKVEEGRAAKDVGERLSEEIGRARAMYEERVSAEVREKGDFFEQAVVAILGGGDAEAVGAAVTARS